MEKYGRFLGKFYPLFLLGAGRWDMKMPLCSSENPSQFLSPETDFEPNYSQGSPWVQVWLTICLYLILLLLDNHGEAPKSDLPGVAQLPWTDYWTLQLCKWRLLN